MSRTGAGGMHLRIARHIVSPHGLRPVAHGCAVSHTTGIPVLRAFGRARPPQS
ncbi:MAG: hypothetical protein KIG22_04520 [Oxalobacter sp.]|nr:hypothetical protein [Oxalobacter sp.]